MLLKRDILSAHALLSPAMAWPIALRTAWRSLHAAVLMHSMAAAAQLQTRQHTSISFAESLWDVCRPPAVGCGLWALPLCHDASMTNSLAPRNGRRVLTRMFQYTKKLNGGISSLIDTCMPFCAKAVATEPRRPPLLFRWRARLDREASG